MMAFDIVPKFRELDLYTISLSFIIMLVLCPEILYQMTSFIDTFIFWGGTWSIIALILAFYALFLWPVLSSAYYVLSKKVPSKDHAGRLVAYALVITLFSSLIGGAEWLLGWPRDPTLWNGILGIFPVLGFVRAAFLLPMMKFEMIDYKRHFIYANTPRRQVVQATIAAVATGLAGKFLFSISPFMLFLVTIEIASAVPQLAAGPEQ